MNNKLKIVVIDNSDFHKDSFYLRWTEAIVNNGCEVIKVSTDEGAIVDKIQNADGLMWHFFHNYEEKILANRIMNMIELGIGLPVFPNRSTAWHFDEKISQYMLFKAIKAPTPLTWFLNSKESAYNFLTTCHFPLVFKLSVGAGSANILKLNNAEEAKKIIDRMFGDGIYSYSLNEFSVGSREIATTKIKKVFNNIFSGIFEANVSQKKLEFGYVLFQEFLPNNKYDIRITVIGERAFGFIRYNRPNDFRASGSGRINFDPANIPDESISLAFRLSKQCKFQCMAYDFLFDEQKKLKLLEISYGFAAWAVHECPGYWDRKLIWHEGHIWPESAQVEDFINFIRENNENCLFNT